MKNLFITIILLIFLDSQVAAAIFAVRGSILLPDGSNGNDRSVNSLANVKIFRSNVQGQISCPITRIDFFRANSKFPASFNRDTNAEWIKIPCPGDVVVTVAEVVSDIKEQNYQGYIGVSCKKIDQQDLVKGFCRVPSITLKTVPDPKILLANSRSVVVNIKAMKGMSDYFYGYTVYRAETGSDDFKKIGKCLQRNGYLNFEDRLVELGRSYYYRVRPLIAWPANNPVYYEANIWSRSSARAQIDE